MRAQGGASEDAKAAVDATVDTLGGGDELDGGREAGTPPDSAKTGAGEAAAPHGPEGQQGAARGQQGPGQHRQPEKQPRLAASASEARRLRSMVGSF